MKITSWTNGLRAALVAGGICGSAAAPAAELDTNLVVNGGFESVDTGTAGPFTSVAIDGGWVDPTPDDPTTSEEILGDAYAYPYSSDYSGRNPVVGAGDWHFTGGFNTAADEVLLTQSIDLSGGASGTLIPTGGAAFNLSGFFSSYRGQAEASQVRVTFLDAGAAEVGSAVIGGGDFVAAIPVDGDQREWARDATAGMIPSGAASVTVDVLASGAAGNYDGYLDLVDFQVSDELILPVLDMTVDRDTGAITIANQTGGPVNLSGYSIVSEAGSLSPTAWSSIAGTADADSGGGVDASNNWTELTDPAVNTDLSEADLDSGDGATLAAGQTLQLGPAWIASPTEDLQFGYVSDGEVVNGIIGYSGNDGAAFVPGDFDTDGDLDAADYAILVASQFTDFGDASTASYLAGDFNRDGVNNHTDFVEFEAAFDAANGAGAFATMVAATPEPGSFVLLLVTAGGLSAVGRRGR